MRAAAQVLDRVAPGLCVIAMERRGDDDRLAILAPVGCIRGRGAVDAVDARLRGRDLGGVALRHERLDRRDRALADAGAI